MLLQQIWEHGGDIYKIFLQVVLRRWLVNCQYNQAALHVYVNRCIMW